MVIIGPSSEKKQYSIEDTSPQRISRTKCCWNSQKADILLSVQRLHCPRGFSKARQFFAQLFLPINLVFTEQSKTCVKNLNPFTIDQGNLIEWHGTFKDVRFYPIMNFGHFWALPFLQDVRVLPHPKFWPFLGRPLKDVLPAPSPHSVHCLLCLPTEIKQQRKTLADKQYGPCF